MNDHDLKRCYHCKRRLPISVFRPSKLNPDKKVGICPHCQEGKIRQQQKYGHSKKGLYTARKGKLKHYFNLTIDGYDQIFSEQNGVCAICNKKCKTGQRLSVDHNHQTGAVRGLLCKKCNVAIGLFSDKIDLLTNAISYLKDNDG